MDSGFYRVLLIVWFPVAAGTFVALLFVPAPYGRHRRPGWGPELPSRIGWMVMESVSPACLVIFFLLETRKWGPAAALTPVIIGLWVMHYLQRSFLYPFLMKNGKKPMAASMVGMAVFFNVVNSYLNGTAIGMRTGSYTPEWAAGPAFIAGVTLFFGGFIINIHSDALLRKLRNKSGEAYGVPRGGFFRFVSSANYLGEIIEWTGWACLTWTWAGLSFAVWTAANLIPRALSHHRWYRETFADYPQNRKAVLPFLL